MDLQSLGLISGSTLLGVAGLRALGAAYTGRRRLRASRAGCERRQEVFGQQLSAALQWARAAKPVFKAWEGTRSFQVAAVVDEAKDCKSFYLVPVDGRPLPRYEPGQFLTFSLPVDPRKKPLVRCYSLSDRPREDYYRVTIKQAQPPHDKGHVLPGVGSTFFHDRVQAETVLEVKAPQGNFFLDPTDSLPVVLIGAGIGITPILSMISTIAHERVDQTAYMFNGFRNSEEHPFRKHLKEMDAALEKVKFDVSYSRPSTTDLMGRDYDHRGYVDIARLKQVLPSNNFRFYLCGSPCMMEDLVPALYAWGVPESNVHFEAFGPASVKSTKQAKSKSSGQKGPCQVKFARANATLSWDGSHETLLDLAESQGVALDYGCRAGSCGQCLVTVRSGDVEHIKEPGLPLDENQCLTCIGVPRGDVELEA